MPLVVSDVVAVSNGVPITTAGFLGGTNTATAIVRLTNKSKFVADRCPLCLRKKIKSNRVGVIETTELPTGALRLNWVIDFTCPTCKYRFRDTRLTYAPAVKSEQVK